MQPVWHHLASTQRPGSIASGTRSQVCPAAFSVAAQSPPDFDTCPYVGRLTRSPFSARAGSGSSVLRDISFGHMRRSSPSSARWSRRSNVSLGDLSDAARYRFEPPPTALAVTTWTPLGPGAVTAPAPPEDWIRL